MRNIKKIVFILICATFFSSCLILHKGSVSSGPLLNVNDRYVDIARGEAQSVIVLGIGSIDNDVLLLDAKKNLFKNRPLEKNEYYANFTTDISRKYIFFPIVAINKVTVSAEILISNVKDTNFLFFNDKRVLKIEYNSYTQETNYIKTIDNKDLPSITKRDIHTGDSVYFYSISSKKFNLYVASEIDKENVMLKATEPIFKNILTSLNNGFFYKNFQFKKYKNGDNLSFEVEDETRFTNKLFKGIILGVSNKTVLIKTADDIYYSVEPKNVKIN